MKSVAIYLFNLKEFNYFYYSFVLSEVQMQGFGLGYSKTA
jgi:hypothetical protein